jgi:hypothetical protein
MITMRSVCLLLAISACTGFLFGQVPAQPQAGTPQAGTPQTGTAPGQPETVPTPLTPVEQRDQQVRQIDPLDNSDKNKAKPDRDAGKQQQPDLTPVPGSIAAEQNALREGPQVVDGGDAETPVQEYTGPAVLSRTYSVNQQLFPEQLKWQETAGVSGAYDTGVIRPVNADGSPGPVSPLIGTMLTWGFGGRHYFRRDMVSVNYSGNYSQYLGTGGYNGGNHTMGVTYSHVLSHRLKVNLAGTGAIWSENSILQNQLIGPGTIADINLAVSPNIQIYDVGAKQFSSQADLTWQETSRLSFSMGTSYFGIEQDSAQLLGMTGQQFRGDVNYRVTRKMTIGTYYSFSRYFYSHGFGNSATNTAGAIYSYAFNRTTQLRFRGGFSEVESTGFQQVQINPVVAALLGQSSGVIDSYIAYKTTDFSAQFVKDFHGGRTTASLAYAHGISPGNGVFQTSQQESISATLTARVFRTYTFTAAVGRDTLATIGLEALGQNVGKYQSEYGRLTLARTYRRGVGLSFGAEYRYFGLNEDGFVRNQLRITSGVTWGSGAGRLWPF